MEGWTYAEVAEALGCPIGTVKSRLSAALARLRPLLSEYVTANPDARSMPSSSPTHLEVAP